MKTLRTAILFCAVLTGGSAWALDLNFHVAGTFSANTATTTISAPNQAFSFDFVLPQQPEVILTHPAEHSFIVSGGEASALTYHFNGSTFRELFIDGLIFDPDGFGVDFTKTFETPSLGAAFLLRSPQVFTGPLEAPTLLTGVFEIDPAKSSVTLFDPFIAPGALSSGTVTISPVPEAGSWVLLGTAAIAGWVFTRFTRGRCAKAF